MKKVLLGIILSLTFVLVVTSVCFIVGANGVQTSAASTDVIDYGIVFNGAVVTSENLSGDGWSYNPTTQVFTLGEEGKSYTFNAYPRHIYGSNQAHTIDGKYVECSSIIQPTCEESYYSDWVYDNKIKEDLSPLTNANRPKKLKIVVKGDVQLGDSSWPGQRNYEVSGTLTNGDSYEYYYLYGGIMWNGEIEISGGGNLQIRSHAYGINSKDNKVTLSDVTVGIESNGNCMMVGDLTLNNASATNRSYSIGGYGKDSVSGNRLYDSANVVSAGTITMRKSYLNAIGTFNRNNTTEPGNGMQNFTALNSRPIYLYDSTVEAKAFVGSGWTLYCKDASGNDLGNNVWIRAIFSALHLYDGSYAIATSSADGDAGSSDDRKRVDFVGVSGSIYAYGNAGVCSNAYEGSKAASAAISGIKWNAEQDKLVVNNGIITNDHTEYDIESYFLNTSDPYYQSKNRYQSQFSVSIRFWKQDTLYLRYGENDQPQASWHRDFSSIINLDGTTVNPADYLAYDGKPCSVAVMSGVFTVVLPQNPDVERYYIAQGGHLKLQMKDGANYGTIHVKSSEYYGITIDGNGTIEYLDCEESKYAFIWSISLFTVPYSCGGSLTVNGGNIKKCKVDGGYNNRVNINGGNVILEGGNLIKHILDFNKLDGTVDVKNGGLSLRQIWPNFDNVELFDGILYLYTRERYILDGIFNYVYVQSEDSYNYYVLPVEESKIGNTITYKFQRFEEKWIYEPLNSSPENKKIYAKAGESVTLKAGQFVKYVVIEPSVLGDFNGLTARLGGSESRELPSNVLVRWYEKDTRTDEKYVVDWHGTLDYTIENVTTDHEFYTYTCEVYKDGGTASMGEFRCDMRVMVMDVKPNVAYVKVGDSITLSASVDKNDRDDWRNRYAISWQVDKGDGKGWTFIDEYHSTPDYEITVDSEEMFNWKYRAYFHQIIESFDGQNVPEYASFEITLRDRGTPSFGVLSVPDYEISGEKGFISVPLNGAYTSATTVYWEYSEDSGESWTTISKHPNLAFLNQGFTIVGGGSSWSPSYFMSTLTINYKNSLDGIKVRCVINDFKDKKPYYSDVHTISVIQMPEIYIQSEGEFTTLETDTKFFLSCWMYGGTSNTQCLQQWQKKVKGSDDWVDIENQTGADFYLGDLTDDAQTTYYRCKLTYKFLDGSHDDIIRYNEISTVNVVHKPTINDDVLNDNLLIDKQEAKFNIDFTANADYPYSVQWQASTDGVSWENWGESKLDTDTTCKELALSEVENACIKYFRAKVTCKIGEVSLDSNSKAVKLYMAKPSIISVNPDHFTISDDNPATITITDYCPGGVKPIYEWQFRKDGGSWRSGSELGIESGIEDKTLVVGSIGANADEWRCLVTLYLTGTDISAQCFTNELTSTYFTSASFIDTPTEETLWVGREYNHVNIKHTARENDNFQLEISKDNGKTWLTYGDLIVSSSNATIEYFDIGKVNSEMDGCLLRVATYYTLNGLTAYGWSPSVKLTVKTGNVSTAKALLEAIENKVSTIKLTRDITTSQSVIFVADTVFDLNGYILKYQSDTNGSVIEIPNDVSLKIIDSNPTASHMDKTIPLGGVITGGTGLERENVYIGTSGGGVFVSYNSELIFEGGTIYKCIVEGAGGGIVSPYASSTVILDGGVIDSCEATGSESIAGGIYALNITINDGVIKNCKASIGGGIFSVASSSSGPESKGVLTLNGGKIVDCTATDFTDSSAIYCEYIYANGGRVYGTVVLDGDIQRSAGVIDTTTAFYSDVTNSNDSRTISAGLYYASISNTNFNGAVKVTFKNGDNVYATLVLVNGECAFAPSELCGSFSWYKGDQLYDFIQPVSEDITLTSSWTNTNNGHNWSTEEIIPQVDATCTSTGILAHWHCTLCNKDYSADKLTLLSDITIETIDHVYGEYQPKVNSTCSNTGYSAHYECSVCHKLFDENKNEKTANELTIAINPNGHQFGEWQVGSSATCATEGELAHRDCILCNKHFDNSGAEIANLVIAKNDNHLSQSDWSHDENGHWHVCTRVGCKDNGKADFSAHTKSADETTELIDIHCTICQYVIENVKPHVHNLKLENGFDKTCDVNGAKSYYVCCNGENPCGKYFEDENGTIEITSNIYTWMVIPAGHTYSDLIVSKASTCSNEGYVNHYECILCHKWFDENKVEKTTQELTIAINPNGHKFGEWQEGYEPDCVNKGELAHTECEYCGKHFDADGNAISTVIPAKGHTYGELIEATDSTCTSAGNVAYYYCAKCNKYFNEAKEEKTLAQLTVPAKGHTFGEWIEEIPATSEEYGIKGHKDCSICNKHFDAEGVELDILQIDKLISGEIVVDNAESDKKLSGGAIAGITVGSVVGAGLGGFSLFWFVIQKKGIAELGAIIAGFFRKIFKKKRDE